MYQLNFSYEQMVELDASLKISIDAVRKLLVNDRKTDSALAQCDEYRLAQLQDVHKAVRSALSGRP
ncbi:MAG: hypothetical protein LIO67_04070 [Lachnospiraceae bacterium]|nr:hypothetical protein [Lachnospiraceae bacterium]